MQGAAAATRSVLGACYRYWSARTAIIGSGRAPRDAAHAPLAILQTPARSDGMGAAGVGQQPAAAAGQHDRGADGVVIVLQMDVQRPRGDADLGIAQEMERGEAARAVAVESVVADEIRGQELRHPARIA